MNCRYSRALGPDDGETGRRCRKNPPVLLAVYKPQAKEIAIVSRFPSVHDETWCGSYEVK